ncbi:MAG: helix-turn-helix domain-containing protein [Pseudobdellovibrio sp.]
MKLAKKQIRKRALLEAQVLKTRRERLGIKVGQLARMVNYSQPAVTKVEAGENPEGAVKSAMVNVLFNNAENFKKRVSDTKRYLREQLPTPAESYEKYNLIETQISQSHSTLNDIKLRNEIYNFFKSSNENLEDQDTKYEHFINEIEMLLNSFYRWHKLNIKLEKSEEFYRNFEKEKKMAIKTGKVSRRHKHIIMPSDFSLRLKNIYPKDRLIELKKTYGYGKGRKNKYFMIPKRADISVQHIQRKIFLTFI